MDANAWLIDLSERSATRFFDAPFAQLTVPEQVFVAVWTLESDVNNGGFDQYYLNSSGDYAWFAPAALRAIGAEQTAAIAERANAAFGPRRTAARSRRAAGSYGQAPRGSRRALGRL